MCISFVIYFKLTGSYILVIPIMVMVAHTYNSSTQKAETGGPLGLPGRHEVHSTFRPAWTLE